MRLNLMLEPQEGMSYADQLAVARRAEAAGFPALYRSDHYTSVGGREGLASTDAWAALAGLAVQTERIALGTLVSPVTFRPAGNLAKVVATVAEMAGTGPDGASRIHLGFGTGWLEVEHRQHGFPFEDLGTRFRRLEEHLQVVLGLWDPDQRPFTFTGEFETVRDAVFAPVPDPRPRIIIGGRGLTRTPRLAARYADELNTTFASPDGCATRRKALDEACRAIGRDPASIPLTLMTGCVVGRTREEFEERARTLQQQSGDQRPLEDWLDGLRDEWVLGTPDQAVAHLRALADAGVEAVMLQHQLYADLDMIDLIAEEIRPAVAR